ncbi:MAG TPA: biotin--[acetyl-CoA-carboxylase] ligase [Actinomycetes bacterium]|nr:biotin--[acetyl-CoA-carboxylase] ligase [Actinomycetes bacterium]
MTRYDNLDRPPLHEASLRRALITRDSLWSQLDVVDSTGSTNADLRAAALTGAPDGTILIAEQQLTGRGRLGRTWSAPARSALTFSVLLRPPDALAAPWGWLPLLAAVAVDDALQRLEVADTGVKWPNDVMLGERKLAGVLTERVDSSGGLSVVVGMGINVSLKRQECPTPHATSLSIAGETTDRDSLIRAVLRALELRYRQWTTASPQELRQVYLERSVTLSRAVRVVLPGDEALEGVAVDVDELGRLVVDDGVQQHALAAADVTHVRPARDAR